MQRGRGHGRRRQRVGRVGVGARRVEHGLDGEARCARVVGRRGEGAGREEAVDEGVRALHGSLRHGAPAIVAVDELRLALDEVLHGVDDHCPAAEQGALAILLELEQFAEVASQHRVFILLLRVVIGLCLCDVALVVFLFVGFVQLLFGFVHIFGEIVHQRFHSFLFRNKCYDLVF